MTARQNLLRDFQSRLRAVEAAARDLRSTTLVSPNDVPRMRRLLLG